MREVTRGVSSSLSEILAYPRLRKDREPPSETAKMLFQAARRDSAPSVST